MRQPALVRHFDIGQWLQANTQSAHLVTREVGRQCRDAIEAQLSSTAQGPVITLNCSGIEHMDFSGADECFAKLVARCKAKEYGDRYLVFAGLRPGPEHNLVVALEQRKLATLVQRKAGTDVLGFLSPYLHEAFALIKQGRASTAREWSNATENDDISLGSTIMLTLYNARLVQRVRESLPDGGRQFVYRLVEGRLEGLR